MKARMSRALDLCVKIDNLDSRSVNIEHLEAIESRGLNLLHLAEKFALILMPLGLTQLSAKINKAKEGFSPYNLEEQSELAGVLVACSNILSDLVTDEGDDLEQWPPDLIQRLNQEESPVEPDGKHSTEVKRIQTDLRKLQHSLEQDETRELPPLEDEAERMDTRSKNSLLKLVAGLLALHYERPHSTKASKLAVSVSNDLQQFDIELGEKTITKYVKDALDILPRQPTDD